MEKKVKRTERGWAGHFICADRCLFRRNTLLEYDNMKIVVSTIGKLLVEKQGMSEIVTVGYERYYETMAFHSNPNDSTYHDIDVEKWIELGCDWQLKEIDDNKANDMHEKAVDWVSKQLVKHKIQKRM